MTTIETNSRLHLRPEAPGPAGRGTAQAPILYGLTGTEAPSRWYTLLPGTPSPEQEDVYLADLNRAGPHYILLTARRTSEYRADFFGIDYDQKIYHWIESNYRVAGEFGSFRRYGTNTFAALIYEKKGHGDVDRIR
jgi:hypothetical protein